MRWSPLLLASLTGLEFAQAHGHDEHEPHMNVIWGRGGPNELRQKRDAYQALNPPTVPRNPADAASPLEARQTSGQTQPLPSGIAVGDGQQCGPTYGACNPGDCCSASGWCGQGSAYCNSPDCQISYGPACDGNQRPSGPDTSGDARPKLGSVPYGGVGIYNCVKQGDVAITYDDGPYIYTDGMLDAFKAHGAVATWFITGNNIGKGMINANYRMIAEGHQVASHTWSHENLDSLTLSQRANQMYYNEIAFTDILGFYPTYMRPPYSICGSECQGQMADLGYHITFFDLDTQGYLHTDPSQIGVSVNLWDQAMLAKTPCNGSYLHIEHDIHQQIAQVLTPHILDSVVANGWKAVTVGECLGDPVENWYRRGNPGYNFNITAVSPTVCTSTATSTQGFSTGGATTLPTSTSLAVSTDASCGGTSGNTCLGSSFGNCCSVNGWCGSTNAYCGSGCQSKFGNCGSNAGSSSTVSGSTSGSVSGSTSRSTSSASGSSTGSTGSATAASVSGSSTGSSTGSASSSASASGSVSAQAGSSTASGTASGSSSASRSSTGTAALPSSTLPVSDNGECGSNNGRTCIGYSQGSCCSQYNYCGSTDAHCGTGCQSVFGTCGSSVNATSPSGTASAAAGSSSRASSAGTASASAPLASSTFPATSDGTCGAAAGKSCVGYSGGTCCSQYNYCGNTDAHCGTGCQSLFGSCQSSASGASSAASSAAGQASGTRTASASASTNTNPSSDGSCGGTKGFNCLGTNFGDCCSPYGYCGNTTAHCDTGCQSGFGKCSGTGSDVNVSLDGKCGTTGTSGSETCQGSTFGNFSAHVALPPQQPPLPDNTSTVSSSQLTTADSSTVATISSASVAADVIGSSSVVTTSASVSADAIGNSTVVTAGSTSVSADAIGSSTIVTTSSTFVSADATGSSTVVTTSSASVSTDAVASSSVVVTSSPVVVPAVVVSSSVIITSSAVVSPDVVVSSSSSSSSSSSVTSSSVQSSSSSSSSSSSDTSSSVQSSSSSSSSSIFSSSTLLTSTTTSSSAAPSQTAKVVKVVNNVGDSCGSTLGQKCGTGLCCTSKGQCATTKVWVWNNSNCYAFNGCQPEWGTCF
ncbi:Chitin deacetylase [Colletotrichum fructicola]|nr:Chitin deacetylase [Colletotrichum fructicola]